MILPLDTHAHIEPDIAPEQLIALRACVIAVTRTQADYEMARTRIDPNVVWAAGCHPGLAREVRNFSIDTIAEAVTTTPVIGEVGLDGTARTPMESQRAVFRAVMALAAETPRILSIHSYRATDLVLQDLRDIAPPAPILHWWLGTEQETAIAIEAGAYFSINASQARRWSPLRSVPSDRLLLETDHPFGDRSERQPRRPGTVTTPETIVADSVGLSVDGLRRQTWQNLKALAVSASLIDMFPAQFQTHFLTV